MKRSRDEKDAQRQELIAKIEKTGKQYWDDTFETASEEMRGDHDVALAAVTANGRTLQHAMPALKDDLDVVTAAVKNNGRALEFASPAVKENKEVVIAAVKNKGSALEYASPAMKADKEVVTEAVKNKGCALEYASPAMKADKEVVTEAVKKDGSTLQYASPEVRANKEVVLCAVRKSGCALLYASQELKGDRDIVVAAVDASYGSALEYASEELQADREIVVQAVSKNGGTLRYAAQELRSDKEIIKLAIKDYKDALDYASEDLKADGDFILEALRLENDSHGASFKCAHKKLQSDHAFVARAIPPSRGTALFYVSREIKNDLAAFAQQFPTLEHARTFLKDNVKKEDSLATSTKIRIQMAKRTMPIYEAILADFPEENRNLYTHLDAKIMQYEQHVREMYLLGEDDYPTTDDERFHVRMVGPMGQGNYEESDEASTDEEVASDDDGDY